MKEATSTLKNVIWKNQVIYKIIWNNWVNYISVPYGKEMEKYGKVFQS